MSVSIWSAVSYFNIISIILSYFWRVTAEGVSEEITETVSRLIPTSTHTRSFSVSYQCPSRLSPAHRRRTGAAAGMVDALIKHQGFCRRCIDVVFILSSLMSTCELDRFVIQVPYIKVRAEVLLGRAGDRSGAVLQD